MYGVNNNNKFLNHTPQTSKKLRVINVVDNIDV